MAGVNTLTFDDDSFESAVLNSEIPVLVDFWAEWCGPCVMLAPTIDELADDNQGKIKVGKLDVDKAQKIALEYGVQNIPTVILFSNGQPVERLVGAKKKKEYQTVIDAVTSAA
jgi:thioredoxin 1